MGLDTFVMKAKSKEDFVNGNYVEVGYWRKCYGVDSILGQMVAEDIEDYVGIIDVDKLRDFAREVDEKIERILALCRRYKAFPYSEVYSINDLEALDIDFSEEDMEQLYRSICSIAEEEFADRTIWGPITTLRITQDCMAKIFSDLEDDDILVWISSF